MASLHMGDVDACDLNVDGFSLVLTVQERRVYHEVGGECRAGAGLGRPAAGGGGASFGFPAIVTGVFDRVFLPGLCFRLEDGLVKPDLAHLGKLAAVTGNGGTRVRALMAGDPPRHLVKQAVWHVCRPDTLRYLALYNMNRVTEGQRERYLARVRREMEAF